ncbi:MULTISPECIES: sigma-70 family RNA polymerase sigma factor [unclassified Streptomyces]|uniref:sigma-70 family RNA polymerase sigma factor n=1 Tax=unclassified Streptomyces TaxID=2593676 RepID=UPI002E19D8A3|nr:MULTISPECIES: sigma-70 family RNA polymerase sigma factor [unclassified Streptomyces]
MTLPTDPALPPGRPPLSRPGRKLGPINDNVGSTHRAWLDPMREAYLGSGLTLNELSGNIRIAKSKLSELLRGLGLYPRWEIVLSLSMELRLPDWPLYRLWRLAAVEEAHKTCQWIERSSEKAALSTASTPPLDHVAFRQLVEEYYSRYAQCFLSDDQRDVAVDHCFDILWLRWNDALSSPDTRRFAWTVMRATVMARTPHIDGRPNLADAAFDTVALHSSSTPADHMYQLTESLHLFKAISRLPDNQLDVTVLRHLCGMNDRAVSALLGVSLASVRSDERHALRFLENLICPPPTTEGNTA